MEFLNKVGFTTLENNFKTIFKRLMFETLSNVKKDAAFDNISKVFCQKVLVMDFLKPPRLKYFHL